MGLSDDPLPTPMEAARQVDVHREDLIRESQAYHLRPMSMSGTAFFLSVPIGALIGKISGFWLDLQWQRVFVVVGAIGLPMLLWWINRRRTRKYERLDAEFQYRRQREDREMRDRQIAEARTRGDFDRWKKDE